LARDLHSCSRYQARSSAMCFLLGALLLFVDHAEGHSWVACTDYRGDMNYFQQEYCSGWPRGYRPEAREDGYQIASPESRAHAGGGCDVSMSSPDWSSAYSDSFPYAIYEQGKVYCLAWPMKNHGWLPDSCANPHSKSDAGIRDSLALYVSSRNPQQDPSQQEFHERNINELAGLANDCIPGISESKQFGDACQLGLEKHEDYQNDCKGFLRAPKFCESSGMSMGTGCFMIPSDMAPGHYVAQWFWQSSFIRPPTFQPINYQTCFDFVVVAPNSSMARPGHTGTTGVSESNLPCQNNALKFVNSSTWTSAPASTTAAPSSTTASTTALTTTFGGCIEAEQSCASPGWGPVCCTSGYTCTFHQDTGYARCLLDSSSAPGQSTTSAATSTQEAASTTFPTTGCIEAEQSCASPGWGPVCCTSGYTCTFHQDTGYARCLRDLSSAPGQSTTSAATTTQEAASTTSPTTGCIEAEQSCASPEWGPFCCTSGYTCTFYEDTGYARCLTQGALIQNLEQQDRVHHRKKTTSGFLAPEHALLQTQTMLSLTASIPKEL